MRKFLATAVLAASAAMFAPSATPQVANNAMALNAAAPQELQAVALQAGSAMAVPVAATSAGLLREVEGREAASWLPRIHGPEPAFAWIFALGFLGLVVTRRIRAARDF